MNTILIACGVISVIVYIISIIMVYDFLSKRKEKIESFLFIRIFVFRYLYEYRKMTKLETGKTGYLFYTALIPINIALLCFVLLLIF